MNGNKNLNPSKKVEKIVNYFNLESISQSFPVNNVHLRDLSFEKNQEE